MNKAAIALSVVSVVKSKKNFLNLSLSGIIPLLLTINGL